MIKFNTIDSRILRFSPPKSFYYLLPLLGFFGITIEQNTTSLELNIEK